MGGAVRSSGTRSAELIPPWNHSMTSSLRPATIFRYRERMSETPEDGPGGTVGQAQAEAAPRPPSLLALPSYLMRPRGAHRPRRPGGSGGPTRAAVAALRGADRAFGLRPTAPARTGRPARIPAQPPGKLPRRDRGTGAGAPHPRPRRPAPPAGRAHRRGVALQRRLWLVAQQSQDSFLGCFTQEEREALTTLLLRLVDADDRTRA